MRSWTERSEAIAPRAVLTERARRWAFEQAGRRDAAVSAVAATLAVAWWTVTAVVTRLGAPVVDDPARLAGATAAPTTAAPTRAAGVDETAFLRATGRHQTLFATGIADLTPGRPARLLDVVERRSGTVLGAWLGERDPAWRAGIVTASLDPFRGYAGSS